MKPKISILNRAFLYKPSYATAIVETWRRFGWRPVKRNTQDQRVGFRTATALARTWHSEHAINRGGSI